MIEKAMEFFWFPKELRKLRFQMRFTAGNFTTYWQRLEVRIVAECTVSVVLVVFVMEMLLKSTDVKVKVMKPRLKAFMDNITVLAKGIGYAKSVLKRLDELINLDKNEIHGEKIQKLHNSDRKREGSRLQHRW